ncbi:glycosyltransferase family 9 protein [Hymenobacter baengnokdamensis]|uniref:glycosyltransferase family 9 protein n=1 Tax=Hymenobacter baengnokdamensis TaxID=2615203 RepID=UPI001243B1D7|nr:glycosyltransferase family 9 protein [Hymenobacter baengnokdamensis]
MFRTLGEHYRAFRRRRKLETLRSADAAALENQARPDAGRVLVLRHDSIGDYLLYRPWLRRLSEEVRKRGQHLTLLANAVWAPLARAWDADCFDELLVLDTGRFMTDLAYRHEVLHQIGSKGFGEIIYPLHVREPAVETFVQFLKAPVCIASEGSLRPGPEYQLLDAGFTLLLPSTPAVLFEYDRNREFFENWRRATGLATELPQPAPLQLPTSVQHAVQVAAGTPYIVLFPGASARRKRWPPRHFARLAQGLHQRYGSRYRLVLAGSPADARLAQEIAQAAGPTVPLENQCGQTDLPGLAALLAGARLLISNDTVAAHLAAQAGTPCLVLLMGENYGKFFPYPPALLRAPCRCLFPPSQEARFAQGDFSRPAHDPDIRLITPARVAAAAEELLG